MWKEKTGIPIYEGYGMTEIAPIAVNTVENGTKLGSAGKAVPDTVIEIVDIETGSKVLNSGEIGEIRVKGPHMMLEYEGNSEETEKTIRDGFIYTGDIGVLDDEGFLSITDRKKDVIFVKGFNVFPREIEEQLMSQSNISSVCVVGKQDDRSGETPIAFITLKTNVEISIIKKFCEDTMLPYKVPSEFIVLENLPLTPAKKVDRAALKDRLI
jgi:long-chain acyl-CoA synthetase